MSEVKLVEHIVATSGVRGGRPRVAGTRLTVSEIGRQAGTSGLSGRGWYFAAVRASRCVSTQSGIAKSAPPCDTAAANTSNAAAARMIEHDNEGCDAFVISLLAIESRLGRLDAQARPPPQPRRRAARLLRPPLGQAAAQGAGPAVSRETAGARDRAARRQRSIPQRCSQPAAAARDRDRLWRRRASGAACAAASPPPASSAARCFRAASPSCVEAIDDRATRQCPPVHRRRAEAAAQAARRLARCRLPALSRPLAQDPPPQAPLRLAARRSASWRAC